MFYIFTDFKNTTKTFYITEIKINSSLKVQENKKTFGNYFYLSWPRMFSVDVFFEQLASITFIVTGD